MGFDYFGLAKSMMVIQAEEITGMRMKDHLEEHPIQEPVQMYPEIDDWSEDYRTWLALIATIGSPEFDQDEPPAAAKES